MLRLERQGIPTTDIATEPFVDEVLEQARLLGMPDYRLLCVLWGYRVARSSRSTVQSATGAVVAAR